MSPFGPPAILARLEVRPLRGMPLTSRHVNRPLAQQVRPSGPPGNPPPPLHLLTSRHTDAPQNKARDNAAKLSAKRDVTLLHPPPDRDPTFYPERLKNFPQYREYFVKKEAQEDKRRLTHMHKGTAVAGGIYL